MRFELFHDKEAEVEILQQDDECIVGKATVYSNDDEFYEVEFYFSVYIKEGEDIEEAIKRAVEEQYMIEVIRGSYDKTYRVEAQDYTAYIRTIDDEIYTVKIETKGLADISELLDVIDAIKYFELEEKYEVDYDIENCHIVVRLNE